MYLCYWGSLITGFSATLILLFIEYMYVLDFKEQQNYILVLFLLLTSIQILFYILMATASLILQFKMNLIKLLETSLRPLIIKKGDYYYFYTKIKHDCNKDNPINNLKMFKDIKD